MIDISVVVPVYNVEDYLRQCMDSVVDQTFENIEIICINDGSTDSSLEILKEYERTDSRIRIITQKNQGLGAARNNGLKLAKGKYICFLDSDDYLELDALEKLYNNAVSNQSDAVLFKFQKFGIDNNIHRRGIEFRIDDIFGDIDYDNFTFTYNDAKRHVLNSAFSACLKLYRKDFLDSYDDFLFPENISFEDIPFHVKVMLRASRLSFVPGFLYNYRSNDESLLNSTANGFDMFEIVDMVEEFLRKNGYYDELENQFIFFKIAQILVFMISTRSEEYFNRTKEIFSKTTIKDKKTIKKYALDGYNLVLNSDSYIDYVIGFYEGKISDLNELSRENKKLRQENQELLSSKSWKITKPLRSIRNHKR